MLVIRLWRILDGKHESELFSCLELWGGSPYLCRLRITLVGPCVSSIDYVLSHIGFMGSHKLSSFDGHRVGWYLTSPIVIYTEIVYGPSTDSPMCHITWKTCPTLWSLSWTVARLFDRCHELWPHVESGRPHVCHVARLSLARCLLIQISVTPTDMGDGLIIVCKYSNGTSLCWYENYGWCCYFIVKAC
jgi:hypothetical protein